ncbi:MAG: hypothetical protein ACKOEL_09560 [Planctomycetota bacterium]
MFVLSRPAMAAIVAATTIAASASSSVVVGWTMPTAFPTGTGNVPTGTSYLPPGPNGAGVANEGSNTAGSQIRSVHAAAAATYTSPSGNGSQYSFSSNNWNPGDFYEISFSTTGITDSMTLSWDQARSSTGPAAFKVAISVNGGAFTDLIDYTVLQSGGGGAPGTWSSTTYNALYTNTLNLGTTASDASSVVIRFVNREAVASAATGSNRIDNVFVNIPAPGAVALLGVAGLAASRRRRT